MSGSHQGVFMNQRSFGPPPLNLYSWGLNIWGSVGDGTAKNLLTPTQVDEEAWAQVSANASTSLPSTTLAIKTNGTLWAWGDNTFGILGLGDVVRRSSPVQVGTLSDWSQVVVAGFSGAAIKTNGTLWTWGRNIFGQLGQSNTVDQSSPVQVGALSNWAQIGGGRVQMLVRKTDNTLWAWGENGEGSLGLGDTTDRLSPVQVGGGAVWANVSASRHQDGSVVAIRTNGTIWSWGTNNVGQLGLGDLDNRSLPTQIGALSNWSQVASESSSTIAVKTDGTLWAWGWNAFGQLGLGDSTTRNSPVQVGALSTWSTVSNAVGNSFAIKTDGTLWAWGLSGGLGDDTVVSKNSPIQVGSLTDWQQVSGGGTEGYFFGIRTNDELYVWGTGDAQQQGMQLGSYSSPVQIGADEWLQVSYGLEFTLAIKSDNSLWAWGLGNFGQLGNNRVVDAVSIPNQIGALTEWAQVSAGTSYALAVKTNGTLWAWGRNSGSGGPLGDGTEVDKSSPVQIGALSDWEQVSAGSFHSLAIKTDGTLWAWGLGGPLGDGTTVSRSSPVQIGALSDWQQVSGGAGHSLAVKTNGTLWAWGFNGSGRLGTGNTISRSSPVQIGALSDWAQVSADTGHSLAVKTNGTLWAWGENNFGQLGTGNTISRSSPVQIGALSDWAQASAAGDRTQTGTFTFSGGDYSLAVKTNGTLWAWGFNGSGRLGDGTISNKSSPVQIGALTDWQQTPLGMPRSATSGALSE